MVARGESGRIVLDVQDGRITDVADKIEQEISKPTVVDE